MTLQNQEFAESLTEEFQYHENNPNASKLLESLRQLDYSNESALCDILDNSIDAGASVVSLNIVQSAGCQPTSIDIWDDGSGMPSNVLREAMRLGSETEKDSQSDLGRYGMGLVTASLSLCRNLSVATFFGDEGLTAVQDLDEIASRRDFSAKYRKMSSDEYDAFLKQLRLQTQPDADSGTIVRLEKIDGWRWSRLGDAEKALLRKFGQTFRKFITSNQCKIIVNGTVVEPIDPIHDLNPEMLAEREFDVDGQKLRVKLYQLEDKGSQINSSNGINQRTQGFYVLRNGREIAEAQSFKLWSTHNRFNLFRGELEYPGSLDELLNAGFTKQNIGLDKDDSFRHELDQFIQPHLKAVGQRAQNRERDTRSKKEDFTDVEKFITRKAHLLKTPVAEKEKRNKKTDAPDRPEPQTTREGKPRLNLTKKKRVRDLSSLDVNFRTKKMDVAGPLYRSEMEGTTTVIYWNIEHPFYSEFIQPNVDKAQIINPVLFLVYSLASSELRSGEGSDVEEVLETIRSDFSSNLRVLMKADS